MPRTATNDQSPPFAGFPTALWSLHGVVTGQVLAQNIELHQIFVVTNIDVVSLTEGTSTSILIGGLVNNAGLFGAETGAGNFDSFSWRGYLPLDFGALLKVIAATGTWDTIAAGFYVPNPLSFAP